MASNFGEYLVETNVISLSDYIKAVQIQIESTPSALTSIIEVADYSETEIFELINKSLTHKRDILSFVDDNKLNKVFEYQKKESRGLADVLVNEFSISSSDISKANTEFQKIDETCEDAPQEEVIKVADEPVNEPAESSESGDDSAGISAAALESLRELGSFSEEELQKLEADMSSDNTPVSEPIVDEVTSEVNQVDDNQELTVENEYLDIFTDKKYKKIKKILVMIEEATSSQGEVSNYINSLFKEFVAIKGGATLVDAKYSKKLIEIWELVFDKLFKIENEELIAWMHSHFSSLDKSVEILWEIRNAITKDSFEDEYMKDEGSRESYLKNLGNLKNIITEMV